VVADNNTSLSLRAHCATVRAKTHVVYIKLIRRRSQHAQTFLGPFYALRWTFHVRRLDQNALKFALSCVRTWIITNTWVNILAVR